MGSKHPLPAPESQPEGERGKAGPAAGARRGGPQGPLLVRTHRAAASLPRPGSSLALGLPESLIPDAAPTACCHFISHWYCLTAICSQMSAAQPDHSPDIGSWYRKSVWSSHSASIYWAPAIARPSSEPWGYNSGQDKRSPYPYGALYSRDRK